MKRGDIVTYDPLNFKGSGNDLYIVGQDCEEDDTRCMLDPLEDDSYKVRAVKDKCIFFPGNLRYEVTIKGSFPTIKYNLMAGKSFCDLSKLGYGKLIFVCSQLDFDIIYDNNLSGDESNFKVIGVNIKSVKKDGDRDKYRS